MRAVKRAAAGFIGGWWRAAAVLLGWRWMEEAAAVVGLGVKQVEVVANGVDERI